MARHLCQRNLSLAADHVSACLTLAKRTIVIQPRPIRITRTRIIASEDYGLVDKKSKWLLE